MTEKLILTRYWDFTDYPTPHPFRQQLPERKTGQLLRSDDDQGWLVGPQIHQLFTAYGESARKMIGVKFDLQITIAEKLGAVPNDYILLLIDIIDECIRYFSWRENGSSFAQIRLSEVRHDRHFWLLLLEVRNRGPKDLFAQKLSEGLLRQRARIEFWSGFIRIDSISYNETTIRAILPIVSSL